ncbi:hypothetical protein KSF78_0006498 [Schistosoma japonicum]|nr:hypothetical protein KSF78_0006498 [Schistosoma japonicum]
MFYISSDKEQENLINNSHVLCILKKITVDLSYKHQLKSNANLCKSSVYKFFVFFSLLFLFQVIRL